VDIFFVISGYLITSIILREIDNSSFSFRTFYVRRIRRIFPALAVVLAACSTAGWVTLLPNDYGQLGKHIMAGAGFVSNLALWNESGYFDVAAETKPLLHLWSLGIEEQFYLVWPALVWLAYSKQRVTQIIAAAAVGSFLINVVVVHQHHLTTAFYLPFTRFWELMAGCALAVPTLALDRRMTLITQSAPCTWTPMWQALIAPNTRSCLGAALVISAIFLVQDKPFPGWWALLPVVGACLLISAGREAWFNSTVLSGRALIWIGLISYPLYLWHWPLLAYARILEQSPSVQIRLILTMISVLLAWATYEIVERPFRFGSCRGMALTVLIPLMGVLSATGLAMYAAHGFEFRFAEFGRSLAAFTYDFSGPYRIHECFLVDEEEPSKFKQCVEEDDGRPLLLLLGDSHAAHLYPGIKNRAPQFRIAQFTSSACPPILGIGSLERPYCEAVSNFALSQAASLRPQRAILAATWPTFGEEANKSRLKHAAEKLRQVGISEIVVVGPVPIWSKPLPALLYEKMPHSTLRLLPPKRMIADGSYPMPHFRPASEVDAQMPRYLADLQVTYVSPIAILCNEDGCLTRADDTLDSIMAWDTSHLTTRGSEYLVEHFPDDALPRLP
jgi:peptidoglycan/LPS O-acetylase OafA/YrhL